MTVHLKPIKHNKGNIMKNILIIVTFLLGSTQVLGNDRTDNYAIAYETAQTWLKFVDKNDILGGQKYISKSMLDLMAIQELQNALSERRVKLGKLIARKLVETVPHGQIYSLPNAKYIAFIFQSKYSNKENVRELIRVIKENGRWKIVSDLLLEKGQRPVG